MTARFFACALVALCAASACRPDDGARDACGDASFDGALDAVDATSA